MFPPDETGFIQPARVAAREYGGEPELIVIHATRGATTQALQYAATKSWFASPNNASAAAHRVISHLGQQCSFIVDELARTSRYGAGYGSYFQPNGWSCDDWGLHLELAQSALQEPFAPPTIERASIVVADWCRLYGIPAVHLGRIEQRGQRPTIAGIVGHDETENGRKLGKSDPGYRFDWPQFIELVTAQLAPPSMENDMLSIIRANGIDDAWTSRVINGDDWMRGNFGHSAAAVLLDVWLEEGWVDLIEDGMIAASVGGDAARRASVFVKLNADGYFMFRGAGRFKLVGLLGYWPR